MSRSQFNFEKHPLGIVHRTENLLFFFGDKNADEKSLPASFPDLTFRFLRQTHSDIIVESSEVVIEADAHFTSRPREALIVKSADCLPVLIACAQTERIAAVHAGWKGVANQIVLKTLSRLISMGSDQCKFSIFIGPHILQSSFEIELDVLKQLDLATYKLSRPEYAIEIPPKYFVDLDIIVRSQIDEAAKAIVDVQSALLDTKTNHDYWSFRRDKEKAGRNLSFVARLK